MTTCATCKSWLLLNRQDKDARAMARLHLVNCAHGKAWEFLPAHQSCPRHQEADAATLRTRAAWLAKAESAKAQP